MRAPYLPLTGQRGLILRVINENSAASGCAQQAYNHDANLVRFHVVTASGSLEDFADRGTARVRVHHMIARAAASKVHGRLMGSSRKGFGQATVISCHTFTPVGKLSEQYSFADPLETAETKGVISAVNESARGGRRYFLSGQYRCMRELCRTDPVRRRR